MELLKYQEVGIKSIIIAKCVALRDGVLAPIFNGFSNLGIEGDSNVIIDCYNRRSNRDAAKSGGLLITHQPVENLWISCNPIPHRVTRYRTVCLIYRDP